MEDSSTGVNMGQSMAIARYFSKKYGMYDSVSLVDFAISEQMIEQGSDFHAVLSHAHYSKEEGGRTAAMDKIFAIDGIIPTTLAKCEGWSYLSEVVFHGIALS